MKNLVVMLRRHMTANDIRTLPMVVALATIVIGLLVSYLFANTLSQQADRDFRENAQKQTATIVGHMSNRLREYEQLLLDNAGVFTIKQDIDQGTWRTVVTSSRIVERFPAMLGIGYVSILTPAEYRARQESGGAGLYPPGDRDIYTAITYLEPSNDTNQRAIGYDMFSEPVRRAAMEQARDNGTVSMSAPVHLVQDTNSPNRRGVLIYYPVYREGVADTVASRREHLRAYVYIVARPDDLIAAVDRTTVDIDNLTYRLYDRGSSQQLASRTQPMPANAVSYREDTSFERLGRTWQLETTAYQSSLQRLTGPGIIMIMGAILSTLAGLGLYRVLRRSFDSLVMTHEESLEKTKNDLLAIASHQLRTPASGVKQYLGILTQGFAGDMTPEQTAIAGKAYNANERQLEIINQILHVAKADADQLKIERGTFDLVAAVKTIVGELRAQADRKQITLHVTSPRSCMIHADERYLSMAIDNLVSNAIKYSDEQKEVTITVRVTARRVQVIVKDRGVGINPDDIERLFVKFSRIDNSRSRLEGGTGLGLFLARHIAHAHHGTISVRSKPGSGSTFTLSLPRVFNVEYKRRYQ